MRLRVERNLLSSPSTHDSFRSTRDRFPRRSESATDLVGRSSLSLTSPLHYYSPSNLPYSQRATTLPPTPTPLLPSLLPTPIPSYPLHTPTPSLPIYLSVRRERERETKRELMREGDHLLYPVVGGHTHFSLTHNICTDLTHNTSAPPTLLNCRIPAPPPLYHNFRSHRVRAPMSTLPVRLGS